MLHLPPLNILRYQSMVKIVYEGSDIGFHFVQIGRQTGEIVDTKGMAELSSKTILTTDAFHICNFFIN